MGAVVEGVMQLHRPGTILDDDIVDVAVDALAHRGAHGAEPEGLRASGGVDMRDLDAIEQQAQIARDGTEAASHGRPGIQRQGTQARCTQHDVRAIAVGEAHIRYAVGVEPQPIGILAGLHLAGNQGGIGC